MCRHPHNVGDVDSWLAPHKGSIATGVVCARPKQISFGDADNHLLSHHNAPPVTNNLSFNNASSIITNKFYRINNGKISKMDKVTDAFHLAMD